MKTDINKINKLFFNIDEIAGALSISRESAKVTASRYSKKGSLLRLKKDFYVVTDKFLNLKEEEFFKLANVIQTPSYISLISALSYYNITTQQQRNFIESISLKRTKNIIIADVHFSFTQIKNDLYKGFEYHQGYNDFFIAQPDKALADIVYLSSLGRYKCDFDSINFKKINRINVLRFLNKNNKKAKSFWDRLCSSYMI